MYEKYLSDIGLTAEQSRIYELLLENGSIQAGRLALLAQLKRPLVYKILEQLAEVDLVEKVDKDGKVARFLPKHPARLKEIIAEKEQKLAGAEASIEGIMGDMVSKFNLISGKPNIRFYEGEKGVWNILEDTLDVPDNEIVYQFTDLHAIEKHVQNLDERYSKKLDGAKHTKRILIPNTEENSSIVQYVWEQGVEYKSLPLENAALFETATYLYKGKIAYISFRKNELVGFVIESKALYDSHVFLFKQLWNSALDLKNSE